MELEFLSMDVFQSQRVLKDLFTLSKHVFAIMPSSQAVHSKRTED